MADYDDNLLLGYVEDDLTEAERATVEKWIAADPRLEALLRGMMSDRQALRSLPQPDAPAWVLEDVDHGLERSMLLQTTVADHEQLVVRQRHVARRMLTGFAMAAMVMLAAGVVIWSITMTSNPPVHFEAAKGTADADKTHEAIVPDANTEVAMAQPRERAMTKSGPVNKESASSAPMKTEHLSKVDSGKADHTGDAAVVGKVASSGTTPDTSAVAMKPGLAGTPAGGMQAKTFAANAAVSDVANAAHSAEIANAQVDAQDIEIVVQTDNIDRTVAQLNDVARNIPNAQLIASAQDLPMPAVAELAAPTRNSHTQSKDVEASKLGVVNVNTDTGATTTASTAPATATNTAVTMKSSQGDTENAAVAAKSPATGGAAPNAAAQVVVAAPNATATTLGMTAADAGGQTFTVSRRLESQQTQQPAAQQLAANSASQVASQASVNYKLVVPADQLQNTLVMLQAPSFNNFTQNVAVRRQNQTMQRQLSQRNAAYWPSRSPDYAAILREQMPVVAAPANTTKATANSSGETAAVNGTVADAVQPNHSDQSQTQNQQAVHQADVQITQQQAGQVESQQATVAVPIVIEMQIAELQASPTPSPSPATAPAAPSTSPEPAKSPAPNASPTDH